MALYLLVTAVVLVLARFVVPKEKITAYDVNKKQIISRVCLAAIFTVLFLLSALRIEVGNDYKNYAITCHEIWVNGITVTEPGFNLLVKAVYTLFGGECYIAVFAVFAFVTTAIFLDVFYKESDSFSVSVFLFMTLGIYFRTFNTVRYYFVLALALYSLKFVARKKYTAFIVTILLASLFHKSVLVVIPLYLLASVIHKKWHYCLMAAASVCLYLGKNAVIWLALKLYPSYRNTEFISQTAGFSDILPGIIQCVLVWLFCCLAGKKTDSDNRKYRICFNLNVMALLLMVFGNYLPLLSRFTYYLMIPQLLLIPMVLHQMGNGRKQQIVWGTLSLICAVYFVFFLKSASAPGIRVLPYKTWVMEGVQEYIYANEVT